MTNHDGPMHWEDLGFNSTFVSLKNAKPGDSWEGWWTGEQKNEMGLSIHLKSRNPGEPKTILPVKGQLKVILERDFKLYDYIKVIYKGQVKLEKGTWAGRLAYDFDVKKAVDFSGEMTMYQRLGHPIPAHLKDVPAAPEVPAHKPVAAKLTNEEMDKALAGLF